MTKQEEIMELMAECHYYYGGGWDGERKWEDVPIDDREVNYDFAEVLSGRLHLKGVVIKGKSLGVSHPHLSNYYTVEPCEVTDEW